MKFIRAPFHPSVTHFMGMLHDLGGEYRPQLILPEEKKQHTSGRRELSRELQNRPRPAIDPMTTTLAEVIR